MSCIYERTKFAVEISYEISDSHETSNDTVYVNGGIYGSRSRRRYS